MNTFRIFLVLLILIICFAIPPNVGGSFDSYDQLSITVTTLESIPVVNTTKVSDIGKTTAKGWGYLAYFGDSMVDRVGVCWSPSGTPTISNNVCYKEAGIGIGNYFCEMTGLTPNTIYYVRSYATNSYGTSYGEMEIIVTIAAYTNVLEFDFSPLNILPPSSSGTITDISGYGNDASYILADMTNGVTVYTTLLSSLGFYPASGQYVENRLIVPPQSGMEQQGDSSFLPLYDLFAETASSIGIDISLLYIMTTFGIVMGLGFLFFLISGSIFASLIAMLVFLMGFFSTGVMPFWIIIFFVAFAFGITFVYRQA